MVVGHEGEKLQKLSCGSLLSKDIKFKVGEDKDVLAVHEIQSNEYTSHISSASGKKAIIDLSQFLPPKFFIAELKDHVTSFLMIYLPFFISM